MDQPTVSNSLNIKNKTFSAPTPQNTPVNSAPISSNYRPTFKGISEAMETQGTLVSRATASLPASVQRRVHGLKYLQSKYTELESQFQQEVLALEKKYLNLYQPLYTQRSQMIIGKYEPTEEEVDLGKKMDDMIITGGADDENVVGIPEFWLTTMKNNPQIGDSIGDDDEGALKHLVDIRMQYMDKNGFQLEFEFTENDYFENKVLTKTYYYQDDVYGGEFVYDHAQGCQIQWKQGKDLTITVESKQQRHKGTNKTRVIKRTIPTDSFFHFFNPPIVPDEMEELDEEEAEGLDAKLEADHEMGEEFKDKIIPHAIDYFTGKALEYEDFEGDDDFEDDFYNEISEEDDDFDDDDDDDENNDTQINKKESAPECKQS